MGVGITNTTYKDSTLTFHYGAGSPAVVEKITSDLFTEEVMMDWEDSIMSDKADIVCHNAGDVLEIGFGMGISADYIQAHNPTSHTIIEIHPQIWTELQAWAVGKTNVTIIQADWIDVIETLGTFDGVLFDTICDINWEPFFDTYVGPRMKVGGKMTYFNQHGDNDFYGLGATFSSHAVTPDANGYFNDSTYYVPTVQY